MMQLRSIVADGDARSYATVTRNGDELEALEITFDPATHTLVANGTSAQPAHFFTAGGIGNQTATRITWNTVTWKTSIKGGNIQGKSRGR
jgi:hypothetical protein